MSNFNKLKEMWENKNKNDQPPPIKPTTFKSTFQPIQNNNSQNTNNNVTNANNHLSLPEKNNINIKDDTNSSNRNLNTNSNSSQNKQPAIIKHENQVIKKNQKAVQKQVKSPIKEVSAKQIKQVKHQIKEPVIVKTQVQRPKTIIPEKTEEPKINKISQMKKLFQSKMPMGFQAPYQPIQPVKIQKPTQNNHPQANQHSNQNIISSKPTNQQHSKKEIHPKVEVQYQASKMSFQQRRRMAEQMLKHKQQAKNNYQKAVQGEKHKIFDEEKEKEIIKKNDNVIQLEQEIYYFDETSRQAAHNADIISNRIFMSALNKKPFYQTNEQANQSTNNVQIKRTVSQAATVTNLQVRKPKPKKRNLQDFDDA